MTTTTDQFTRMLQAVTQVIADNAEMVTELDQAIGDGDHVFNLQRGLEALTTEVESLQQLPWNNRLQKIGMTLMSTVGGASGSLYGTLFVNMAKALQERTLDLPVFVEVFAKGVTSVKQRGKADVGEKTLLDVLVPVADTLQQSLPIEQLLANVKQAAFVGAEATRDMLATKGRAAFLGERSRGHLDAGAKTAQLMVQAIVDVLAKSA